MVLELLVTRRADPEAAIGEIERYLDGGVFRLVHIQHQHAVIIGELDGLAREAHMVPARNDRGVILVELVFLRLGQRCWRSHGKAKTSKGAGAG